jgi:undecaprenyl-diphosphatase
MSIGHEIIELDSRLALYFNHWIGKSPSFDLFVVTVSNLGIVKGGVLVPYFWALWFKISEDGEHLWRRFVIRTALGACIAILTARILQLTLPFHPRPVFFQALALKIPEQVELGALNRWSSFPSDHMALFTALAFAILLSSRAWGCAALTWVAVMIALPRLYVGIHYLSDILGGAATGCIIMLAAHRYPVMSLENAVLTLERRNSPLFYAIAFLGSYELVTLFNDFRIVGSLLVRALVAFVRNGS